jgi:hypothetical protein
MATEDWIDDCYDGRDAHDFVDPFRVARKDNWHTKNGDEVRICDMTDSHLLNAWNKSRDELLFEEMVFRLFEQRVKGESK